MDVTGELEVSVECWWEKGTGTEIGRDGNYAFEKFCCEWEQEKGWQLKGNLRSQGSVICRVKKSGACLYTTKDGAAERERLFFPGQRERMSGKFLRR